MIEVENNDEEDDESEDDNDDHDHDDDQIQEENEDVSLMPVSDVTEKFPPPPVTPSGGILVKEDEFSFIATPPPLTEE